MAKLKRELRGRIVNLNKRTLSLNQQHYLQGGMWKNIKN